MGQRRPGGGSGGRQGRVGQRLPLQPAGPGRRPRPPRGRSRPSPREEAARLPAAWDRDIGAPARARLSAAAPPRLLAVRWPRSGRSALSAARGSPPPAPGDRLRSASSSCWAVSAAPRGPGGRRGRPWRGEGLDGSERAPACGCGPRCPLDGPRPHRSQGAARQLPTWGKAEMPGARVESSWEVWSWRRRRGFECVKELVRPPLFRAPRHRVGAWIAALSLLRVALTFKSLRPQPTPRFFLAPHPILPSPCPFSAHSCPEAPGVPGSASSHPRRLQVRR